MFFRFAATLAILTGISIYGMSLEKENLKLKRRISEQHYDLHGLDESRSRLYLQTQQLGAPPRLMRDWQSKHNYSARDDSRPADRSSAPPLLQWRLQQNAATNR